MNADIDYVGILNLLQQLVEKGAITKAESRKIAGYLAQKLVTEEVDKMSKQRKTNGNLALNSKQKVVVIEASEQAQTARLRVAAYCWVSSSSEDQLKSFAAQNCYYTTLIAGKENWELVDIYGRFRNHRYLLREADRVPAAPFRLPEGADRPSPLQVYLPVRQEYDGLFDSHSRAEKSGHRRVL